VRLRVLLSWCLYRLFKIQPFKPPASSSKKKSLSNLKHQTKRHRQPRQSLKMLYLLFTRLTNTNKLEKVSTEVASEHNLTPTFPCSLTCISPQAKGTSKNFTRFLVNIYKLNTSGANKWHNVQQSISRARSPWVSERWVKFSATDQEKCGLWKSDWQQPGKRAPSLSSIPSPNLYDAILIVKPPLFFDGKNKDWKFV